MPRLLFAEIPLSGLMVNPRGSEIATTSWLEAATTWNRSTNYKI
jgi:hypothetical protein